MRSGGRRSRSQDYLPVLDKGCEPKVLAIHFRLDSLFFRKTKLIEQLYHEKMNEGVNIRRSMGCLMVGLLGCL